MFCHPKFLSIYLRMAERLLFQVLDIIERSKVDNIENIYADSLKDDRISIL